jgi:hypothetical protein
MFAPCSKYLIAWPSATALQARGLAAHTDVPSYEEMLDNWRKFGFIVEKKKNILAIILTSM